MKVTSAELVKGIVEADETLEDGHPQVAFIGRSNVGKSSVINSLVGEKDLARSSSLPGRTREINLFLINKAVYLLDLPGYGYAKASWEDREKLQKLISWYLLESAYKQKKVVLIIDAEIGPTKDDMAMLKALEEKNKEIVIVANKVDKIKKTAYEPQMQKLAEIFGKHKVIPYSANFGKEKIGVKELAAEILG